MRKTAAIVLLMGLSASLFAQTKTGTLKIFTELTGTIVYLDDNKQEENVQVLNNVPVGTHYLKVLKDGVSVYGELITIQENTVTTVLVKNTGQIQEKILDTKVKEKEEYNGTKLDIILSTGSITQTQGRSTLFPGYYSYYGYSNSLSSTTQTTDWKIIQGGVKEINESTFFSLTGNSAAQNRLSQDWANYDKKDKRRTTYGLISVVPTLVIAFDIIFHDSFGSGAGQSWFSNSGTVQDVEGCIGIVAGLTFAFCVTPGLGPSVPSGHYISVDNAAKDAREYNRKLKVKLGLPESYDVK
jgi:hypothetical protein